MSGGDPIFEAKRGSMQAHAVNGVIVTALSQIGKLPFQIASILVLPRLLEPTDYGIAAMVDPLVSISLLLLNFGLLQAIIQRPALTRGQVSALFWLMFAAGFGGALIMFLCSPLVTMLYNEPRAGALASASALFLLYAGLANIPVALMNRQMKFGWLAVINFVGVAVGLLVGVLAAKAGLGYWSLTLDYGATCLVTLIGVWLGVGWLPRDRPDFRSVLGFYKLGGGFMLSDAATLFARHSDAVLIGRYAGPAQLGLYDRGNKLAIIPMERINQLLERILLPILSRMMETPERYRAAYLRIIRQMMLFLAPGTVAVAITAPVLIPFLLGEKWAPAAPIFSWLALAALHQPVSMTMAFLFISQARASAYFVWSLFAAVTSLIAFVVGLRWGAIGVAAAFAITDLTVRLPFLWWMVTRKGPIAMSDLYGAAAPFAAGALATGGVVALLQRLAYPNDFIQLAVSAIGAYAASLAVIALFRGGRMALADTARLASTEGRRILLRRSTPDTAA